MEIIWGFTSSDELQESREIGSETKEIKQIFSALLFKSGINGICTKIEGITGSPDVKMKLVIDSKVVHETSFSPTETTEYFFEFEEIFYPEVKIEIIMEVEDGTVLLPISSIGNGMGFQKIQGKFVPTKHLALGLILA